MDFLEPGIYLTKAPDAHSKDDDHIQSHQKHIKHIENTVSQDQMRQQAIIGIADTVVKESMMFASINKKRNSQMNHRENTHKYFTEMDTTILHCKKEHAQHNEGFPKVEKFHRLQGHVLRGRVNLK